MWRKILIALGFLLSVAVVAVLLFYFTHMDTYQSYYPLLQWSQHVHCQATDVTVAGLTLTDSESKVKSLCGPNPASTSEQSLLYETKSGHIQVTFADSTRQVITQIIGRAATVDSRHLDANWPMKKLVAALGDPSITFFVDSFQHDSSPHATENYKMSLWYFLADGRALVLTREHSASPADCQSSFVLYRNGRWALFDILENPSEEKMSDWNELKLRPELLQDNLGLDWTRTRAKAGDAWSQYRLAHCLEKGIGCKANGREALALYRKSAAGHCPYALYAVSRYYASGKYVPKDDARAVRFCNEAAFAGVPEAQYVMAVRYEQGTGVDKNPEMALELYNQAASNGIPQAKAALQRLRSGR